MCSELTNMNCIADVCIRLDYDENKMWHFVEHFIVSNLNKYRVKCTTFLFDTVNMCIVGGILL